MSNNFIRLGTTIINSLASTLGILIICSDNSSVKGTKITSLLKCIEIWPIEFLQLFFGLLICHIGTINHFDFEKSFYFQNCYQKNQIQKEYYKYLDNLEEAVISRSQDGIRYFNTKAINLLKICIQSFQDEGIRQKYNEYLKKIEFTIS